MKKRTVLTKILSYTLVLAMTFGSVSSVYADELSDLTEVESGQTEEFTDVIPAPEVEDIVVSEENIVVSDEETDDSSAAKAEEVKDEEPDAETETADDAEDKADVQPEDKELEEKKEKETPEGTVSASVSTATNKYTVTVSDYDGPADITGLKVTVWSETDGKDDVVSYDMTFDGSIWTYEGKQKDFKHFGKCFAEVFAVKADSTEISLGTAEFSYAEPTFDSYKLVDNGDSLTATITNFACEGTLGKVSFGAYFDDQAGRIYYTAVPNGSDYSAVIDYSDFGNQYGKYHVAAYLTLKNGRRIRISNKTITRKEPASYKCDSVSFEPVSDMSVKYKITVKGAYSTTGIKNIQTATWSKADQSDIVWAMATKNAAGDYVREGSFKDHGYNQGTYTTHVYLIDDKGIAHKIGEDTTAVKVSYSGIGTSFSKTTGLLTLSMQDMVSYNLFSYVNYGVLLEGRPESERIWVNGSLGTKGKYSAKADLRTVGLNGKYHVAAYGVGRDGKAVHLGDKTITISGLSDPAGCSSITFTENLKNYTYKINITGVHSPKPIKYIQAATWSEADQSNICWYRVDAHSSADYELTNKFRNNGYKSGTYKTDIYIIDTDGKATFLGTVSKKVDVNFKTSPGTITFADKGTKAGNKETNYKITISDVVIDGDIDYFTVDVFLKGEYANRKSYKATRVSEDVYETTVSIKDFGKLGQYRCDVYAVTTDKQSILVNPGSSNIMNVTGTPGGTINYVPGGDDGKFDVVMSGFTSPSGVSTVQYGIWVDDDQNDIYWYSATKQSDGSFKATVDIKNHKYHAGNFKVDAYVTMGNGVKGLFGQTTITHNAGNYTVVEKTATGRRRITVVNPQGAGTVHAAIWSSWNDQDDLHWFNFDYQNGPWVLDFAFPGYNDYGEYKMDIYVGDKYITSTTFYVEQEEMKSGWFYENGYKYLYDHGQKVTDLAGIIAPPYQIVVNRSMCVVTVYGYDYETGQYIIPVKALLCSTGIPTPDMETPTGRYYTGYKSRWHMLMGPSWGQYTTHVVDGIFFHSVAGINQTSYNLSAYDYNNLGNYASHGCIRLTVAGAKWLYDYVPEGTPIDIYDSDFPGAFGKPDGIKIPDWQTWDPTDPAVQ